MTVDICLPDAKAKAFVLDAISEYRKRLSRFCDLRLFYGTAAAGFSGLVRVPESLGSGSRVNALVADGSARDFSDFSSEEFAAWIQGRMNRSASGFVFWVLNNAENPAKLRAACDLAIKVAYVEMDWDMTALILTEQIYRAFMILSGSPYHK